MLKHVQGEKLPPSHLLQMPATHLLRASLSTIEAEEGVPALGLLAATTAATAAPAAAPAAAPKAGRTGALRAWGGSTRLNDMLPKGRRPDVSRVSTSPPYEFNVGSEPGEPLPAGPLPRARRRRHTKTATAARAAGAQGCSIASEFLPGTRVMQAGPAGACTDPTGHQLGTQTRPVQPHLPRPPPLPPLFPLSRQRCCRCHCCCRLQCCSEG